MMLDIFMVTHLNTSKSFGLLTEKKALSFRMGKPKKIKKRRKKEKEKQDDDTQPLFKFFH